MLIDSWENAKTPTGKEALSIGKAAEIRFAQRLIYVLNLAGAYHVQIEMSEQLDGGEKVDIRLLWALSETDMIGVKDFQVSITPKSKLKQKKLAERGIVPVVVSPFMSDEEVDEAVCFHLFPGKLPERYVRYASLA